MRAVVLSGGPTHDFGATTACLGALLEEAGFDVEVHARVDAAFGALPDSSLLVVNAALDHDRPGGPERYRRRAGAETASPSPRARDAFAAHLAAGEARGGVVGRTLDGASVLVTGGGSGIGEAVVHRLVAAGAGRALRAARRAGARGRRGGGPARPGRRRRRDPRPRTARRCWPQPPSTGTAWTGSSMRPGTCTADRCRS